MSFAVKLGFQIEQKNRYLLLKCPIFVTSDHLEDSIQSLG